MFPRLPALGKTNFLKFRFHIFKNFFLKEMKRTGIRVKTDPRFRPVVAAMEKFKPKPNASLESLNLVMTLIRVFIRFCKTILHFITGFMQM